MNRLVMMAVTAGAALAAMAMPTRQQLAKAQEMVSDVTAADVAALKAGAKKPAEVAAKHMELAAQAGSEAERYLLLQGAFRLYVKGEDYDNAAKAIETMQTEIKDFNPEVIVELCGKALVRKMQENAPRLYAIKENARRIVFYRKQLPIREAAVRKNPKDPQAQRRLAECHAELGDWPKALEVFAKAGGEFKKMAEGETSGKVPAQELGDFWWDYETKSDTQVYKLHAAELYRKALADDSFKGLARTRAEQRVKEVAGNVAAVAVGGQGTTPRTLAATGLYCVIDLSGGPDAKKYPVSYLNDMPKGGWSDEYKTTKLVLRRIEPGAFEMGKTGQSRHVEIEKPFYIGVFEVSQKQWSLVMGDRPAFWKGPQWFLRPIEQVPYERLRGKDAGSKWPESDEVDAGSFMGLVRQKTGLRFDLPTEAQWEYACRAGAETDFYNNTDNVDWRRDSSLDKIGRYQHNGGWNEEKWGKFDWGKAWSAPDRNCETNNGTAAVGSYQPNMWGLYDMLGNVHEWCLDYQEKSKNDSRVLRGGTWVENAYVSTSHFRGGMKPGQGNFDHGFRLCLPLAGGVTTSTPTTTSTGYGFKDSKMFCVIDVAAGPKAKRYAVTYVDEEPNGGWTLEEKTKKIVLRKVKAGGDPLGRYTISKDYYIGVFEVSQEQWERVMGSNPSEDKCEHYPVTMISTVDVRGVQGGNKIGKDGFAAALSERTGIVGFDLPTEAQWDYANRMGAVFKLNDRIWERCRDNGSSLLGADPLGNTSGRAVANCKWKKDEQKVAHAGTNLTNPCGDRGFRIVLNLK